MSDVFVPVYLFFRTDEGPTTAPLVFELFAVKSSLFILSRPRDVSANLCVVLLLGLPAYLSLVKVFLVGLTKPLVDFLPVVVTFVKVKLCGVSLCVGVDGTNRLLGY